LCIPVIPGAGIDQFLVNIDVFTFQTTGFLTMDLTVFEMLQVEVKNNQKKVDLALSFIVHP